MRFKNWVLMAATSCLVLGGAGCTQDFDAVPEDEVDFVHDEGQPWCDELAPAAAPTNCALLLGEDHLLFFEYAAAAQGHRLSVNLNTLEGQEVQSFGPVLVFGPDYRPAQRDIDGDEREELFIPLQSGNGNTLFGVWHQDEEGYFHRAGELSGVDVDAIELRDGLVISHSRGSAVTSYETASRLVGGGLASVYELEINQAARSCQMIDSSGLAAARLNADEILAACQGRDWE